MPLSKGEWEMDESQTAISQNSEPRATYQDVLDAPPNMVAELIDGKLYTLPRPSFAHCLAHSVLFGKTHTSFHSGGPDGWWILTEPELHLGKDVLVPDIAGWRRGRMPEAPKTKHVNLAPDWLCEVLSPSTRKVDLLRKRPIYAREAVPYLWFVDPGVRTLEAYRLCGSEWVLIDSQSGYVTVSQPPFETMSFDLGELWIDDEWASKTVHKAAAGADQAASL